MLLLLREIVRIIIIQTCENALLLRLWCGRHGHGGCVMVLLSYWLCDYTEIGGHRCLSCGRVRLKSAVIQCIV